jgi:hypothetical protein
MLTMYGDAEENSASNDGTEVINLYRGRLTMCIYNVIACASAIYNKQHHSPQQLHHTDARNTDASLGIIAEIRANKFFKHETEFHATRPFLYDIQAA